MNLKVVRYDSSKLHACWPHFRNQTNHYTFEKAGENNCIMSITWINWELLSERRDTARYRSRQNQSLQFEYLQLAKINSSDTGYFIKSPQAKLLKRIDLSAEQVIIRPPLLCQLAIFMVLKKAPKGFFICPLLPASSECLQMRNT